MNKLELLQRVAHVSDECERLFDVKLADHNVSIKLERHMGRTAGQLRTWLTPDRKSIDCMVLRFNLKAAVADPEHMINETIPHEVAHAVTRILDPASKERSHGNTWLRVFTALGGSGARTHQIKLKPRHAQRRWLYIASCGSEVPVSTTMHKKIQSGDERILSATGGRINAQDYQGPFQPEPEVD